MLSSRWKCQISMLTSTWTNLVFLWSWPPQGSAVTHTLLCNTLLSRDLSLKIVKIPVWWSSQVQYWYLKKSLFIQSFFYSLIYFDVILKMLQVFHLVCIVCFILFYQHCGFFFWQWFCFLGDETLYVSLCLLWKIWNQLLSKKLSTCFRPVFFLCYPP